MKEVVKKPYLLTGGIGYLFENRHGLSLGPEIIGSLEGIEASYAKDLGALINGKTINDSEINVEFVSGRRINNNLRNMVSYRKCSNPLVSFDDVCCVDLAEGFYSVTRVMDPNNLEKGTSLGPRFGDASLEKQVDLIKYAFGNKIDVIDIGVFEGETLVGELEKRFLPKGVQIENVYVGFAGPGAKENLAEYGTKLHSCWNYDWVDWLEIRDCLGLDGRKILMNPPHGKINSFIPYTVNPEKWASIPAEQVSGFRRLYDNTFKQIQDTLKSSGYNVSLKKSKHFNGVLDLEVE